jgi:hypothetical protein
LGNQLAVTFLCTGVLAGDSTILKMAMIEKCHKLLEDNYCPLNLVARKAAKKLLIFL